MSGRIAISQIPVQPQLRLPVEAKFALISAKNWLRVGIPLRPFSNEHGRTRFEGPPLPAPSQGCAYFEVQVGQARPQDPMGPAGTKRLVLEVNVKSRQVMNVYYTTEHYGKFTFVRYD